MGLLCLKADEVRINKLCKILLNNLQLFETFILNWGIFTSEEMAAICMLSILIKDYLLDLKMKGSSLHTVENYGFHLDKFAHFLEQNEYTYSDLTAKQAKLFRNYLVDHGFQ